MDTQDDLITYYRAELEALRRAGNGFAKSYPKVASALDMGAHASSDPHVERLIESFAYLTARLQKRMDDRFPEITTGLLGALYPHMVQPVPPMTIAQCALNAAAASTPEPYEMPAGTQMFATSTDGVTCRFQTCYDTTVWPLRVTEVTFPPKSFADFLEHRNNVQGVLRLRLEPTGGTLAQMSLDKLRFFLSGEAQLTGQLYELILGHTVQVALFDPATQKAVLLPPESVSAVGFSEDEAVIPFGAESHPAYRLLQEYFTLPEKFLFFDVSGLSKRQTTDAIEILFLLDTLPRERMNVTAESFRLGCTPVINLFAKTSEPIRVDHRRTEYRLVADARRERTTEIHSIRSVVASTNPQDSTAQVRPFYDFSTAHEGDDSMFWFARRQPVEDEATLGTETVLSFVDLNFDPRLPPSQTVYAHMLCTNRGLATELQQGAALKTELPSPLGMIRCLLKPTPTGYPPLGGSSRWALISNLSLNYLSLGEGEHSLAALKKMLRLYSLHDSPAVVRQIQGMRSLTIRPVLRRMGSDWKGWSQGKQVRITVDESFFEGVSLYLFAAVLRYFFALYGDVNSFSELVVETTQKTISHRFAPLRSGVPRS